MSEEKTITACGLTWITWKEFFNLVAKDYYSIVNILMNPVEWICKVKL